MIYTHVNVKHVVYYPSIFLIYVYYHHSDPSKPIKPYKKKGRNKQKGFAKKKGLTVIRKIGKNFFFSIFEHPKNPKRYFISLSYLKLCLQFHADVSLPSIQLPASK